MPTTCHKLRASAIKRGALISAAPPDMATPTELSDNAVLAFDSVHAVLEPVSWLAGREEPRGCRRVDLSQITGRNHAT
jgi:hypothetical protein